MMFYPTASNNYSLQILPLFLNFLYLFQTQIIESIEEDFAVDNKFNGFEKSCFYHIHYLTNFDHFT